MKIELGNNWVDESTTENLNVHGNDQTPFRIGLNNEAPLGQLPYVQPVLVEKIGSDGIHSGEVYPVIRRNGNILQ